MIVARSDRDVPGPLLVELSARFTHRGRIFPGVTGALAVGARRLIEAGLAVPGESPLSLRLTGPGRAMLEAPPSPR